LRREEDEDGAKKTKRLRRSQNIVDERKGIVIVRPSTDHVSEESFYKTQEKLEREGKYQTES